MTTAKTTPWFNYTEKPSKDRPGRYECTCGQFHLWLGLKWRDPFVARDPYAYKWRGLMEKPK